MTKEYENNKSMTQLVVAELLTGKPLKSKEIAEALAKASIKEINTGYVSSILSRISNKDHCDLGLFIKKTRQGNALVYSLVHECLALKEDQAFGLCLKTGNQKYPLSQALKEYPELGKYIELNHNQKNRPVIQIMKKIAEKGKYMNIKPFSNTGKNNDIEISLRYSSKYAVSITGSVYTFALICLIIILTISALCFAVYLFIYPILLTVIAVSVIVSIGMVLRRQKLGKD